LGTGVTLAALIILDDDRPTALVLGLAWPEFQLRRAVRAGALHLVLVSDRVTRDVVEAVDRLRSEGLSTTLARTNAEVADLFHPDEAVLLLTGSHVVGDAQLARLLTAPKPTLLCIDAERAGTGQELIDAKSHWVGIARIDGGQIRATVPVTGDWDLGSTLLRNAVAARAARRMLDDGDLLIDASTADGVARASQALVAAAPRHPLGWGARWVVAPVARLVAHTFPGFLPLLARIGPWATLAMFVLAPALQLWTWTPAALALYLLALATATSARLAASVTGIPQRVGHLSSHFRDVAGVALLAQMVAPALPDFAPLVLGLNIIVFAVMSLRLATVEDAADAPWLADHAGDAIILMVGSIFGQIGLLVGMAVCATHGIATLVHLQNRLSRVLTSLR
jgi:hypothetical protein